MKDFKERVKNTWAFRKLSESEKELLSLDEYVRFIEAAVSLCDISPDIVKELWLNDINVEFEIIKP